MLVDTGNEVRVSVPVGRIEYGAGLDVLIDVTELSVSVPVAEEKGPVSVTVNEEILLVGDPRTTETSLVPTVMTVVVRLALEDLDSVAGSAVVIVALVEGFRSVVAPAVSGIEVEIVDAAVDVLVSLSGVVTGTTTLLLLLLDVADEASVPVLAVEETDALEEDLLLDVVLSVATGVLVAVDVASVPVAVATVEVAVVSAALDAPELVVAPLLAAGELDAAEDEGDATSVSVEVATDEEPDEDVTGTGIAVTPSLPVEVLSVNTGAVVSDTGTGITVTEPSELSAESELAKAESVIVAAMLLSSEFSEDDKLERAAVAALVMEAGTLVGALVPLLVASERADDATNDATLDACDAAEDNTLDRSVAVVAALDGVEAMLDGVEVNRVGTTPMPGILVVVMITVPFGAVVGDASEPVGADPGCVESDGSPEGRPLPKGAVKPKPSLSVGRPGGPGCPSANAVTFAALGAVTPASAADEVGEVVGPSMTVDKPTMIGPVVEDEEVVTGVDASVVAGAVGTTSDERPGPAEADGEDVGSSVADLEEMISVDSLLVGSTKGGSKPPVGAVPGNVGDGWSEGNTPVGAPNAKSVVSLALVSDATLELDLKVGSTMILGKLLLGAVLGSIGRPGNPALGTKEPVGGSVVVSPDDTTELDVVLSVVVAAEELVLLLKLDIELE
ncbi:hypothetical protein B0A48_12092 [Cryoendolithus antarcticus]|uniref:Uncharacterized protein n=1 Tax=Cryoendolithus antarcticus TaxID=1507870 RepID=A0A1V8SU45_9PEZI|nr:hypothetical protein B0A48_12092 [Cryoendolithus antarcticus]